MQDQESRPTKSLATHGRTIHWGHSRDADLTAHGGNSPKADSHAATRCATAAELRPREAGGLLSANRRFPLNLRPHYNFAAPEVDFTGLATFNLASVFEDGVLDACRSPIRRSSRPA